MFLKKIGAGLGGAFAVAGAFVWSTAASALPYDWQTGFQPAASPVMERIEDFHKELLVIITLVSLFVLALLVWIMVRYNRRSNPTPSKTAHNTLLEVVWTIVPVIILVIIAIPSFRLLYFQSDIPQADVTLKAIGKQWFWTYEYPTGNFTFDSLGLSNADADKKGEPHLLGVDNVVVVPVNKVVEVETTGADVIHSWAVPGRINHTWFKATAVGTYYGECSELCGARHAFMPIEVKVVTQPEYEAWLAGAKKKFAAIDGTTRVAAK